MSRQIEMEFSYGEKDKRSSPIFAQDLLTDLIETRVSYAASLNLDASISHNSSQISELGESSNTKI